MVLQTIFYDGKYTREQIYHQVFAGKNYVQFLEGFLTQRDSYQWGELWQLKGKQRILKHKFGTKNG